MSLTAYRSIERLAHRLLPWAGGKVAVAVAGRDAATAHWVAWAATLPSAHSLVWVHASSVGEWLAAAPVIRRLKASDPHLTIALTYSSPSLAQWGTPADADRADYVPPDAPAPLAAVFDALRPRLLLISRGDLWPELLATAHRRAVPVAVIAGVISPRSRRLVWPWRSLLQNLCRSIGYVGAVTGEDAERFIRLGVPAASVEVTGDPRHDQVLERIPDLSAIAPLVTWGAGRGTLVAGSTHPRDEAVVLSAFAEAGRAFPEARLIVVPHEPGPAATHRVRNEARRRGLEVAGWPGTADLAGARIVVVQALGPLADLYACGELAYLGGGFEPAGVHTVLEPAAYGVPVIFGPRGTKSADARRLLAAGGATLLSRPGAVDQLARTWTGWLGDPPARVSAGLRARRTMMTGAAATTATAVLRVLERYSPQTSPTGEPPVPRSAP